MPAQLSENSELTIPLRNLLALIAGPAIATMTYFSMNERINFLENEMEKMEMIQSQNTEFRIRWPRGELGSLPADTRQDMLIEGLQRNVNELRSMQDELHKLKIEVGTREK